jgi:histidinol-phosphate aminotransferase
MAVVCTPNNPSTEVVPAAELARALDAHPDTLFCIDGVFDWYVDENLADLCRDHDNVVVLKSFSKLGLAGLRLGYVLGRPDLVADLQRGLSPFAVPELVQRVGLEVARRFDRIDEIRSRLDEQFAVLADALGDRVTRHAPLPFYLLETACGSTEAAAKLAAAGVAVVDGEHFRGLPPRRLRIAIGDAAQNRRLLGALDRLGLVA